ncbi:MAG: hypothetical protein MUE49_08175 [Rhodospirillales bacterium]|jgi:hypothetical protein|nr:hypothetical protein [Rhodospirillales bacterium]
MERFVAFAKDIVALLRDAALMVLAGLLLLFPARFNDLLVSAGFEEGSLVGFKWKAKLVEADQALNEAQATIAQLQAQLDRATKALGEVKAGIGDAALKAEIAQIAEDSERLTAATAAVQDTVKSTITAQASLVERAQTAVGASAGWGVVFGSDVSLAAAQDETLRAARAGIPAASIYFRNGYFASIAVVDDRGLAQQYLAKARTFRADSYVASMATWCLTPQPRAGYIECAPRR